MWLGKNGLFSPTAARRRVFFFASDRRRNQEPMGSVPFRGGSFFDCRKVRAELLLNVPGLKEEVRFPHCTQDV